MKYFRRLFINYWPLFLILFIAGAFFLLRLQKDLLWDWDECLYAVNARELKATGTFLYNQWNGYADFQKPPLYTWLLQIPYTFAINEFSTRILSVIAGLCLIALVYVFSKKYFSQSVAILSSLLLLTAELFVIYTTKASTDIFYSLFIFLGFYWWLLAGKQKKFSYLAGLAFGLSTMVKGLSTLQFLIPLFLSIFLNANKEKFVRFLKVALTYALVIFPWHLAAYLTHGSTFFRVYFLENIIRRSTYPIEFHRERWYFYITLLYKEWLPWIAAVFFLPVAYLLQIKKFRTFAAVKKELKNNELLFTLILFIVIPLVLLTRIRTRIAWYAMPIYPFLAVYLAYNIDFVLKKFRLQKFFLIVLLVIMLDAGRLMVKENRVFQKKETVSPRNEVAIHSSRYSQKELNYLVAFAERQAKDLLPPEEQISQTWVFGGNACAVFYSGKRVHYFYSLDDFKKRVSGNGLFLIENGDLHVIKDASSKILFQNREYTLFEKN